MTADPKKPLHLFHLEEGNKAWFRRQLSQALYHFEKAYEALDKDTPAEERIAVTQPYARALCDLEDFAKGLSFFPGLEKLATEAGVDEIALAGLSVTTVSTAMGLASQVGSDVVFNFGGGDTLTVLNVLRADLFDDLTI